MKKKQQVIDPFALLKAGFNSQHTYSDFQSICVMAHPIKRRWYHRFIFHRSFEFSDGTYKDAKSFKIKKS